MNFSAGTNKSRIWIIGAALSALFLGALDALVMSAAMPTIIAELGGLHLYAWTYTAFFLARAVSLPVFGKLSDLYSTKKLFLFSIGLFLIASICAGASPSMGYLVAARVFQGIGGGGIFALVYVVLSDISTPADRAKTLALASSIWGLASLVGPTLGGFIVTWFSWRWVFFINIPLGIPSLIGIALFFKELRKKPVQSHLDVVGVTLLSGFILGFLILIMIGGRQFAWVSLPMILIGIATCACGAGFYLAEKHAKDPILDLKFFKHPAFALGNGIVFCVSFSIFALFAYAPLFLQGTLSQTPLQVGYAMLSLSLGWSLGSIIAGRKMHWIGPKKATFIGVIFMVIGTGLTLGFSRLTTITQCFFAFQIVGLGMGFTTLSTLLIVQNSVDAKDLGVATSFHQFARTMGGTIGVGLCGGIVTAQLISSLKSAGRQLPGPLIARLQESMAILFQKEFQSQIPEGMTGVLQGAVLNGVSLAFVVVFIVSIVSVGLIPLLPHD
jgi:EmrB/QacA subfamily drug resistance transporter